MINKAIDLCCEILSAAIVGLREKTLTTEEVEGLLNKMKNKDM